MVYFHSVKLDKDKCHGCTNCISHCPTEAIRVRHGKAKIIKERCIDCGECIRVCKSHAKIAAADSFDMLKEFKYNIAMPAPSFYSQFGNESVDRILTAFLKIGFDDCFEVALGAEYISQASKQLFSSGSVKKPVISSACPAVLRLIREKFPNLLGNVLNLISPMEAAAMLAREKACSETGLPDEEIGVFFISPCPAKVSSIKSPLTLPVSNVSGAISAKDAFVKVRQVLDSIDKPLIHSKAGFDGIFWAKSGGESSGLGTDGFICADGIHNVINVLEEIEYGKVDSIDFVELSACVGGCTGGPLNIVNPYLASSNILQRKKKSVSAATLESFDTEKFMWKKKIESLRTETLDSDFEVAMQKMEQMEEIYESLPKLDCGSCGAPSCRALAEDVVRGFGNENDCIFKMRGRVRDLAKELFELNENHQGLDSVFKER